MDSHALRAALNDLAEYGFIVVESPQDAIAVQRACPMPTTCEVAMEGPDITHCIVRVVTPNAFAAAR